MYLWSACTSKVTKLCDLGPEDSVRATSSSATCSLQHSYLSLLLLPDFICSSRSVSLAPELRLNAGDIRKLDAAWDAFGCWDQLGGGADLGCCKVSDDAHNGGAPGADVLPPHARACMLALACPACSSLHPLWRLQLRVGTLCWSGHTLSSGSRDRLILQRDVRSPLHWVCGWWELCCTGGGLGAARAHFMSLE